MGIEISAHRPKAGSDIVDDAVVLAPRWRSVTTAR